jgi:hypothetical protein
MLASVFFFLFFRLKCISLGLRTRFDGQRANQYLIRIYSQPPDKFWTVSTRINNRWTILHGGELCVERDFRDSTLFFFFFVSQEGSSRTAGLHVPPRQPPTRRKTSAPIQGNGGGGNSWLRKSSRTGLLCFTRKEKKQELWMSPT